MEWCAAGTKVPDGAVRCGSEGAGRELYFCVIAGSSPSRFGKFGLHLGRGCVVSTDGTREEGAGSADVLEVLCSRGPPGLAWATVADLMLMMSSSEVPDIVRLPGTHGTAVGSIGFKGGRHPCAVDLDGLEATVLWGGAAHRVELDPSDASCWVLTAEPCDGCRPADVFQAGLDGVTDAAVASELRKRGCRVDPLRCGGIGSLADLLAWAAPTTARGAGEELPRRSEALNTHAANVSFDGPPCLPRADAAQVLVCHDFKGGFLGSDRGMLGSTDAGDAYTVEQWPLVDVFCFFAHRMVAVPPRQWVANGKRHGARVIGTFIIEGSAETIRDILVGPESVAEAAAAQLALIAQFYGFDGWLFNVEVPVPPATVPALERLVGLVRHRCRQAIGPGSIVMWYDAVDRTGAVAYANRLDPRNANFAQRADCFFTNYWWTPAVADVSVATAKGIGWTPSQVFQGVDVFGRNTYGGGGANTHVAVAAAFAKQLSSAIFAPGWTLEGATGTTPEEIRSNFLVRDASVWDPIADHSAHNELCVRAPGLATSFCPASEVNGSFAVDGLPCALPAAEGPWCQPALQEPCPRLPNAVCMLLEGVEGVAPVGSASFDSKAAYFGTRSMRFDPAPVQPGTTWIAGVVLVDGDMLRRGCRVAVVTKGTASHSLKLSMVAVDASSFTVAGAPIAVEGSSGEANGWSMTAFVFPVVPGAPAVLALCASGEAASPWHLGRLAVAVGDEITPIEPPPAPRSLALLVPRTTGGRLCRGWFFAEDSNAVGKEWDLVANFGDAERRTFLGRVFAGPSREAAPVDVPAHLVSGNQELSLVAVASGCHGPVSVKLPVQVIVA